MKICLLTSLKTIDIHFRNKKKTQRNLARQESFECVWYTCAQKSRPGLFTLTGNNAHQNKKKNTSYYNNHRTIRRLTHVFLSLKNHSPVTGGNAPNIKQNSGYILPLAMIWRELSGKFCSDPAKYLIKAVHFNAWNILN